MSHTNICISDTFKVQFFKVFKNCHSSKYNSHKMHYLPKQTAKLIKTSLKYFSLKCLVGLIRMHIYYKHFFYL